MLESFKIESTKQKELIDITRVVVKIVSKSKVNEGLCLVFTSHTTAAIIMTELEEGLDADILSGLEQLKPKGPFKHAHNPDHSPSHIFSGFFGPDLVLPVENAALSLGTWQRVLFLELDGPRERKITVVVK